MKSVGRVLRDLSVFIPGAVHLEDNKFEDTRGQDNEEAAAVQDIAVESAYIFHMARVLETFASFLFSKS